MEGFRPSDVSSYEQLWAAASTANATSCQFVDPHGFATGIRVITGQKYWVSLRRKSNSLGPTQTSFVQGKGFSWICEGLKDDFEAEALLLEEGMAMYNFPLLSAKLAVNMVFTAFKGQTHHTMKHQSLQQFQSPTTFMLWQPCKRVFMH
jgi:hypothetical protein